MPDTHNVTLLAPSDLRLMVDPLSLGFADTSELVSLALPWIGQERAQHAARFGLSMAQPGYNLFVLGEVGTGRSTLMKQLMIDAAAQRAVPPDLCYLHNFEAPEQPRALRLAPGEGRVFRQLMAQFSKSLQSQIPKRLSAPDVKAKNDALKSAFKAQEDEAYAALTAYAQARHFGLMRDEGHLVFTLRDDKGDPVTASKSLSLSPEKRLEIDKAEDALLDEINRFLEKTQAMERDLNEQLAALRRQMIQPLLTQESQRVMDALHKKISDSSDKEVLKLGIYLDQVQHDVLENLALFLPTTDEEMRLEALDSVLSRCRVNLVVDNHDLVGAPVILEDNPAFHTLFGSIEYETDEDVLVTDFSRIRAGSLLKAHGGFLMLHLRDLLSDEPVWEKLRRFLRSGRLQIEEPGMAAAPIAAVSLRPEAIQVDVKIVLIGSIEAYYAVQDADPETAERFRCKVDFAETFKATSASNRSLAIFVAHTCHRLGLLHFSAAAVAALIEETHREAEDQTHQSAVFASTEALVIESSVIAQNLGAAQVQAQDVRAAKLARIRRHNYPEEQLQDMIVNGERLLTVTGERVAQVNGLTVLDLGDYQFGFPIRITACTHAGEEGLLNIEREVKLSGPIHDKGVLIFHSYLSALFSHIAPLAFNASVVFEQEYSGVEGDSASCAEFYALLSSLSGLPLTQSIAITGAMNQHGDMLPVGGINEKIEGYFRSCELLGLNGQQGVLMPSRNRHHLMLDPRVVDAVREGQFHIYTAERVSEGMRLLTGLAFGELEAGAYPPETVLGRVQKTLEDYRRACNALGTERKRNRASTELGV
jgi:predicted ATP-dependent protease